MGQLQELEVLTPQADATRTRKNRKDNLRDLIDLRKMMNRIIKIRGGADCNTQRGYIAKSYVSLLTIVTEAIFVILFIAVNEIRDFLRIRLPGTFLQILLSVEDVHGRQYGGMAELLVRIDPKLYRSSIAAERGKPVLLAEL